jgi:hypothetical protein
MKNKIGYPIDQNFTPVELSEPIQTPETEKPSRVGHQVQSGKELMMCPGQSSSAKESG